MTHLESWSSKKGVPACGADSFDQTQRAQSVTCSACQRWLVKQWAYWTYEGWLEKETYDEGEEATHYVAWGVGPDRARGLCLQRVEDSINATGTVEFVSCAACQHALASGWMKREAPRFRCAYCAGETLSWTGTPTGCGHCKRPFLDVRDDPEFVTSVHGVVDAIRDHVLKYRDRYGSSSGLAIDLDHVCARLMTTINEEWQDEDRIYTPAEQQLDTRIDGWTARREAA